MAPKKKTKEEYIVEKIVDMKEEKGKKLFLVKWKGWAAKDNTWEPTKNLDSVKDMVAAYEKSKAAPKRKEPEKKASPAPAAKKAKASPASSKRAREEPAAEPAPKKAKASPAPAKEATLDVMALARGLMAAITGKKEEKPEKPVKEKAPPKEKKAPKEKAEKKAPGRKKKGEGEVIAVDKITGMKTLKGGGVQYQILWMDGSKSWEPEDNVMDDDLVDEFEEKEQEKAYSDESISAGSEVEVKANEDGFENSWSSAIVKKKAGAKFVVEYAGFVDDNGKAMSETVERKRLRLVPEAADKSWSPVAGEIIEVNEDDCWWEARVLSITGKKAELKYRVSDEIKSVTLGKKMRPCNWLKIAGKGK